MKHIAQQTNARVCIHAADKDTAQHGSDVNGFEPFNVDMELNEGDVISLGDKDIYVYHTPGHTPGCCSFRFAIVEDAHQYDAILFGGPGVNVFQEKNLSRGIYGGTMEDFENTLERLTGFPVQVWLGAHPDQNDTFAKRDQLQRGAQPNPFIDPEGWQAFLASIREKVRKLKESR